MGRGPRSGRHPGYRDEHPKMLRRLSHEGRRRATAGPVCGPRHDTFSNGRGHSMKKIRIGSGSGFWGDNLDPAIEIAKHGDVQYLAYDFLGEPTIPSLQKMQRKDASRGYVPSIRAVVRGVLPICLEKGIKILTNAGAANPQACADTILTTAKEIGITKLKVGIVTTNDVQAKVEELLDNGVQFTNLDNGDTDLGRVRDKIVGSYVYSGAYGYVEALEAGCDIIISDRATDDAAILAPLVHEFGWKWDEWDNLAVGILAGHLIECGAACSGGISSLWREVPEPWNIGYPIAEVNENGELFITKVDGTGGVVNQVTLTEHLLYEVHDPGNYLMPEVITDFTNVEMDEVAKDRVKVWGAKGKPRPDTLKAGIAYMDGFIGEAESSVTWPDAVEKAERSIDIIKKRLEMVNLDAEEVRFDMIGVNSCHWSASPAPDPDINEVRVRVAAKCAERAEAAKVARECVMLMGTGPIGSTGQLNTPPPREVFALWPTLIPREEISQTVETREL
ncbi:acyclic terpene utilization AtuA family protein [Rhodococcus opacus]|uniref:acyclic terpene utilization AtuA family protein n=1 Tax=Rhodococcus opacus TaxID=37919 RepID=UPI0027E0C73E|nr:acyclic terpene utilization AtuA family protein [Rhodococcus opacus]